MFINIKRLQFVYPILGIFLSIIKTVINKDD